VTVASQNTVYHFGICALASSHLCSSSIARCPLILPSVHKLCTKQIVLAGRAGLLGADEAAARLRQEARLMRERAAEARSRLQSTHVSTCSCLLNVANCMLLAAASRTAS